MLNEDYGLLLQEERSLKTDGRKYIRFHSHVFISYFPMDRTCLILLILQDLNSATNFFWVTMSSYVFCVFVG